MAEFDQASEEEKDKWEPRRMVLPGAKERKSKK